MSDQHIYWFLTFSLLLASVLVTFLGHEKSSKTPFPPGPKPRPLIGNLPDAVTPEPWLLYMKWEEVYQSKILGLTLPGKRIVILNAVEDVIELFEKRAGTYSDRARVPLLELTGWTFATGLMRNNERWRSERRIFQQTFKREAVPRFLPIQTMKVHAMLRQLLADPASFANHYRTLSASIVLEITYGYEIKPKNDRIVEVVERAIAHLIENGDNPSVAALNVLPALRYLPRWFPGMGFHKIVDDCKTFTQDMLNIPYEYTKKCMREDSNKPSLVRSLLESDAICEESVKGIGGTVFSAGTDTVVSVIECFFFAMSLHPEKQRKAQEEIDRIIGADRLPTFKDKDSLPYIDAIFRETMRWLPPFPLTVPHVAEEDDIYKGTKLEDPDSFIPERCLDENGEIKENTRILSFGFGRRLCPGQHLATNTVWLTIATVLASFDIGLPFDEFGNPIKFHQVHTKADALHLKPYRCTITPRSVNARKLVEATEDTAGY
ncbi:hypothetical protein NP233_g3942 [Leucocoprinus birnbaumii]|uniref:Cytochrome P450 n=1 Tax=Leucocoprinus birnbaumii TaxID=56174 RepID=A0AAD5VW38_9AGAR|nr:hypothetical protein NP233_g3942 [Leucocoprinus birnbaumii]